MKRPSLSRTAKDVDLPYIGDVDDLPGAEALIKIVDHRMREGAPSMADEFGTPGWNQKVAVNADLVFSAHRRHEGVSPRFAQQLMDVEDPDIADQIAVEMIDQYESALSREGAEQTVQNERPTL